jgi:hypothetical protein
MKTASKILSIIALAAVIAFTMTTCGDGGGGGSNNGNNNNNGTTGGDGNVETLNLSGMPVEFDTGLNAADFEGADFSYNEWTGDHLSKYIDGDASVTIKSGKVNIKFGLPKSFIMENLNLGDGVTVTPSDVKCSDGIQYFCTSDRKYNMECIKDDDNSASFIYVDKDVTINGTENSAIWNNVVLKKGWNFILFKQSTYTHTSGGSKLPAGYKWVVS